MKKIIIACGVAAMMIGATGCGKSSSAAPETFSDSLAYYMGRSQGLMVADHFKNSMSADQKKKFDSDAFLRGFKQMIMTDTADADYLQGIYMGMNMAQHINYLAMDSINIDRATVYAEFAKAFKTDTINSTAMQMEVGQFQMLMNRAQDMLRERQMAAEAAKREAAAGTAKENEAKGAAYIKEQIAADASIKTTESGLAYKVVKQGEGPMPKDNSTVKVHYTGKLIDGTVFDSSVDRGEPADFPVTQVIPGFSEGLKMMNKGSKYVLYIPASLGYGNNEAGSIPAGSTLVFEVEMIEVN
ncbi:FKBP-type peptidyl-prolyl cis-trans isomerase [Paramuribaculum intestinale]|uniref:FKBP-type peptidyl-prolyl cis-trans isomerase n=1 Tax=Paramuribaculum intestinale TaxID=2094151 RepID=UPI0025A9ACEA|nr:FKBP-type peptidyl-prolyl cis-trans isomerase [Paramuribaculum intestinale]